MSGIAIQSFDRTLAMAEKAFNVLGWIPLISSISGPIRMTAGRIEAIAFSILSSATLLVANITENKELFKEADRLSTYIWHGMANFCRGAIETVPLLGNFLTISYDLNASSRMSYPMESRRLLLMPFRI